MKRWGKKCKTAKGKMEGNEGRGEMSGMGDKGIYKKRETGEWGVKKSMICKEHISAGRPDIN